MKCKCCYCGSAQEVETPPSLHECTVCHKEFRTYKPHKSVRQLELTEEAREHYLPKTIV